MVALGHAVGSGVVSRLPRYGRIRARLGAHPLGIDVDPRCAIAAGLVVGWDSVEFGSRG